MHTFTELPTTIAFKFLFCDSWTGHLFYFSLFTYSEKGGIRKGREDGQFLSL